MHQPPEDPRTAVEIPQATKQRLGLDGKRSWIICDEANRFIWPGPDLRPVSRTKKDKFTYGFLPQKLLNTIKLKVNYLRKGRNLKIVSREE